ncbi:MAG TPA: hypothetical protein DCG69_11585 [Bacteroidales bacterium]|nr:hypothetical protein [Bacteroidales bacterium]
MGKKALFFFIALYFSFHHQAKAQNEFVSPRGDTTLASIAIRSGKAQIKNFFLFPSHQEIESLYLEVRFSALPQNKYFVQNPIRIEVLRQNKEKTEAIEIARFFMPWANEKTDKDLVFSFDISAYSSLFDQAVVLQLESSNRSLTTNFSLKFKWKKGTAPAKVHSILNLWHSDINGIAYADKSKPINQQLKAKIVKIPKNIKYALLRIYLSGYGSENKVPSEEECSKFYFLSINKQTIAKRPVWRDDCGLNALFPQAGPWTSARTNWCPGQTLRVYDHFIALGTDTTLNIGLQLQETSKENPILKSFLLSANLILFEEAHLKNDAALVEILAPTNSPLHNRYNPICSSPVIRVKNTGSDTLKTVLLKYGLDQKQETKYRWRGELAFMEEEIVYLPPLNWYFYSQRNKPSSFFVSIAEVNQKPDQENANNQLFSEINLAPVYPNRISIQFTTNLAAADNIIELVDDMGIPLFEAANFANDSTYTYNLDLLPGCYELIIYDKQGDGIYFPAKKTGKGSLKIIATKSKEELSIFEPNFGAEIRQQFMILK